MASSSGRKSGSSGRSNPRKRVVIGAAETVRVTYDKKKQPRVESERKTARPTRESSSRPKRAVSSASVAGKRISNAKREERERRQRGIRARRLAIAVAAVGAVFLVVWGLVALYRAPIFTVDQVVVEGASQLTSETVIDLARIPREATLVRLPARAIGKRLEAQPWIVAADVERDYPHTVRLVIKERAPAVIVDAGGTNLWVVSKDGRWLGLRSAEQTGLVVVRDLPSVEATEGAKVTSPELLNAIKVARGMSDEMRARVHTISAPTIEKTALLTDDNVEIFVGEGTDMRTKDRIAREILKREGKKVVYINVRVVESPTWRGLGEEP